MMGKVVVTHGSSRELAPLKGAVAALGYDVIECGSAFETLQFMAAEPVEALISSVSLPDLNGYQLACLVKSMERTRMLPIIVVNLQPAPPTDDFVSLVNRCQMVVEAKDSSQALNALQTLLPRSLPRHGPLAGTLSKTRKRSASSMRIMDNRYSAENLLQGTADVLNELLIEKVVVDKLMPVFETMESRSAFAEHFFEAAKQLVDCSICGLVLANTASPWGAVVISGHHYRNEGLSQWLKAISEDNLEGREIDFDVRGRLYDDGDSLPEPSVFEVGKAQNTLGLLIFVPAKPSGFDDLSLKVINCLQEKMGSLIQVRLDRERLAERQRFPIVTDELTGAYNVDFLVGFIQQQLLFSFRQRAPLSLVLLHVEGIREVNSKIGWEVGDHLLAQIASWLANHTRGSDIVARCSGNTFALVLPNTNLEGAEVAAEKYVAELGKMKFASDVSLQFYAGWSAAKPPELNPEILLRDAQSNLKSRLQVSNISHISHAGP
jgi:diguanylate cyclase (GGDEF)-like protein